MKNEKYLKIFLLSTTLTAVFFSLDRVGLSAYLPRFLRGLGFEYCLDVDYGYTCSMNYKGWFIYYILVALLIFLAVEIKNILRKKQS